MRQEVEEVPEKYGRVRSSLSGVRWCSAPLQVCIAASACKQLWWWQANVLEDLVTRVPTLHVLLRIEGMVGVSLKMMEGWRGHERERVAWEWHGPHNFCWSPKSDQTFAHPGFPLAGADQIKKSSVFWSCFLNPLPSFTSSQRFKTR